MGNQTTRPGAAGSVGAGLGHTHKSLWNLRFLLGCLEIPLPPPPSESRPFILKTLDVGAHGAVTTVASATTGTSSSVYTASVGADVGGPLHYTVSVGTDLGGVHSGLSHGPPLCLCVPGLAWVWRPTCWAFPKETRSCGDHPKGWASGSGAQAFSPRPLGLRVGYPHTGPSSSSASLTQRSLFRDGSSLWPHNRHRFVCVRDTDPKTGKQPGASPAPIGLKPLGPRPSSGCVCAGRSHVLLAQLCS